MGNEIKQRIVLEGEKEYNAAIKEAQRNLRTLKSELKAETAELGANATAQQKAETRAKSLKAQIAEQEKVVQTLRAALDEVKEKYGDNADEVARWEQRLNNARTTLAGMRNDLENTGSGLASVKTEAAAATVATKSVGDALSNISQVGESVSAAIESIFTGMISMAMDAVSELWDLITDTAGRANRWTDLANYYNSSAQEIQMWSRSIEAAGGNFENFLAIVNKLAYGGNEQKITELLGISKENYQDDVDYALAVLDELELRRRNWSQNEYDDVVSQIFGGKKSADVSWFLSNAHGHEAADGSWIYGWRDNPQRFNGDESGYGMSTGDIQVMNDLWIKVQEIEVRWNALKDNIAGGLGRAVFPLLINVEGALDGLAEYLMAEDSAGREAALQKVRQNVEEFFHKLADLIRGCLGILRDVGSELQQSEDPLTRSIGDVMVTVANVLEWLVNNADKVKAAFETIFGLWLLMKLAALAAKLASVIAQIKVIQAFSLGGAAAGAAGGGGSTLLGGVGALILKAAPWMAGLYVFGENALTAQGNNDIMDEAGNLTEEGRSMGLTMNQNEWNAAMEKYRRGDESDVWDEYGNVTQVGRELQLAETREEQRRRDWIDAERRRYDEEGNLAAEWALYGTHGLASNQYWGIQNYWDKYRTGTATTEDWERLNSHFQSEEMQQALIGVLQQMYRLDRSEEDVPDWMFGLEQRWEDVELEQGGLQDSIREMTDMLRETVINDRDEATRLWMDPNLWKNGGQQDGITGADLRNFQGLPGLIAAAAQNGVAAGVSGLRVEMDGATVGWLVAPYVSEMIARDITA